MATIHIPDAFLSSALTGGIDLDAGALKCALINIATYDRAADSLFAHLTEITGTGYTAGGQALTSGSVTVDTTNHKTVITYTPAVWTGATTISATGAAVYDTVSGRIVAVSDFGGAVSSSGGTYTVNPIVCEFTHF